VVRAKAKVLMRVEEKSTEWKMGKIIVFVMCAHGWKNAARCIRESSTDKHDKMKVFAWRWFFEAMMMVFFGTNDRKR
jgi:hypothetical protein